ncbi:arylamine N-acetyltransferase 1 [Xylogone sp. PMI_703]|nr:arylamine N-acetyltransferase 1 [Xylogone sp. PMI_703]
MGSQFQYTPSQLTQYLNHIGIPPKYHPTPSTSPSLDHELLTLLQRHHITTIPYENLDLHYNPSHAILVDPEHLFNKIVVGGRGRGGYCMESGIMFHYMLRTLGFRVYMAGVRVRGRDKGVPGGPYRGWIHIVNIVTLSNGSKFMLDVAFGGDGPTLPLLLIPDQVHHNLGTQEVRLQYAHLPEAVDQTQKFWIYQYRNGPTKEWNSFYSFPEMEFLHSDFENMNYFTSTSRDERNFQTKMPIIVKFLMGDNGEVVGKVALAGAEVKRNTGGKTELIKVCESENERVKAIKEIFGIELLDTEVSAIKGLVSALPFE